MPSVARRSEKQEQKEQALKSLRESLKPGDTVYTVLRSVSRSGMSREIDLYIFRDNAPEYLTGLVARACGFSLGKRGLKMGGCGMDMGFHAVYELAAVLFPDGFTCTGKSEDHRSWCPSNDHSNGDRDYKPHHHKSGGYALRHSWM
jgi:hypothetical protein